MISFLSSKTAFVSLAALGGMAVATSSTLVGCTGEHQTRGVAEHKSGAAREAVTATVVNSDGTTSVANVTGSVYYWNGDKVPGNEVYGLVIGANFHAVSGCKLADFNAVVGNAFNKPVEQLEDIAKMNPETGLPYP